MLHYWPYLTKEGLYRLMSIIGCLSMFFLFSLTIFFLTWPYEHALDVAAIQIIPDVIEPGEQLNIFSTYTVSMDLLVEISVNYVCESGRPESTIQNMHFYFIKGEYNNIESHLVTPSRLVTEMCYLEYLVTLKPNPLRRINKVYKSQTFTLKAAEVKIDE